MAIAILFCTGVSAMCLLMIGIMADMEPNTAKHNANAPVARASCLLGEDFSCMPAIALLRKLSTSGEPSCRSRFYASTETDA
jgi:hypothetical protein